MAEVDIDGSGNYQAHRIVQPSYICLNCGAPAIDLGQVPVEIAAENEEDARDEHVEVLCPMCETMVVMGPELECPNCGSPLGVL